MKTSIPLFDPRCAVPQEGRTASDGKRQRNLVTPDLPEEALPRDRR